MTKKTHEEILTAIQRNQAEIDATVQKAKAGHGDPIPTLIAERHPLITQKGYSNLKRLSQNANAPRWNYFTIGDKVNSDDLKAVEKFRKLFFSDNSSNLNATHGNSDSPSESILAFVEKMRSRSAWFEEVIPESTDFKKSWTSLKTMARVDIATRFCDIAPYSEDYDRLIVYDTSGTTGHAIVVPHHPQALALNHVFAEYALKAYGISTDFSSIKTACINVCAQQNTYVFHNIFSVWNEAAFAKVNLKEDEWATGIEGARQFFKEAKPHFITADPVTIAEMMRWQLPVKPAAIFSTALALSRQLKEEAEQYFECPVIDWYSTTETGPIAFSPPCEDSIGNDESFLKIFGPDIFLELLDEDGHPVPDGERGEITITGGRNPWLPLLRYRTGDYASFFIDPITGTCDRTKLCDFLGREPVVFRATNGSVINAVDIARAFRLICPFVQHQFTQRKDFSCNLLIKPLPSVNVNIEAIEASVRELFGKTQKLTSDIIDKDSDKKLIPYVSEVS